MIIHPRQLLTVLSIFTVVWTTAAEQPTTAEEPAQFKKRTFVPEAGYTRTVREEQLQRALAERREAQGVPPTGTLSGTRLLPVICVNFKNVPPPSPMQDYQKLLFGSDPADPKQKTMTRYYNDISNQKLHVTGKVLGWYTLPKDDTYYENGQQGGGTRFGELLQFALEKADAEIDFGQFDNDGPDGVPNSGDDDGKVDTVVIIQGDSGGECNGGHSPHVWSHSWHYSDKNYGHAGMPFVTRAIRRDSKLNPVLGPDGKPQHIVIEDYVIQPAISCPVSGQPAMMIEIGVFCHEYGHALGLPDLYDRTYASSGVGNWCLMSGGSYGGDGRHADTPVSMSAWCKEFLGWANVKNVTTASEISLEAVEDRNVIYRIDVPNTNDQEYFLVEYRHNSWSDPSASHINWDANLPVSGLAVWHIDDRVGKFISKPPVRNDSWPFTPQKEGQNDWPTLPNPGHTGYLKSHSLVALVEADGSLSLARNSRYGAGKGDLWITGMNFGDDPMFIKGSRSYDGRMTGIGISAINLTDYTALAEASKISAPIQPTDTSASQTGSALASNQTTGAAEPATAPSPAESPAEDSNSARPGAPRAPNITGAATPVATNVPQRASTVDTVPHTLASRLMAAAKGDAGRSESLTNVNRLLNTANFEVSDLHLATSKEKSNGKKLIATVNEELTKQGIEKIRAEDVDTIGTAQPTEIRQNVEPENRPIVQALAAESRTKEISHDTKPATSAESNIVNLLKTANQTGPATIQSAPEGNRLERVTDLSVPAKTTNVKTDAKARVTVDLKQAIGQNVQLKPKDEPTTESPTGTVAKFEQIVKADNKALPVFGSETELYYSKEATPKLTAITNKTVSAVGLVVKGVAGQLSISDAKAIVAKELKMDAQLLKEGKEGIYLVGDNPKNARVSVLIPVRVDDHHEDIKVFVDSQTKQILDIK